MSRQTGNIMQSSKICCKNLRTKA